MPACTSISKKLYLALGLMAALLCLQTSVWAADEFKSGSTPGRADTPEAEDFSETPYTNYGEFNEDEKESETQLFFQHGRFFGVSIGAGIHGATGNRGLLWKGGFPVVNVRLHYWFSFYFALQMGFTTVSHNYLNERDQNVDVNMVHMGVALKYYLPTQDLSAAVTFASPFLLIGAGSYKKSETIEFQDKSDEDAVFGFAAGAGVEFPIEQKSIYFVLEGQMHFPSFKDRLNSSFADDGIPDLTGAFYQVTGNFLFTW